MRVTSVRVTRDRLEGENVLAIRVRYDIVASLAGGTLAADVEQTVRV